MLISDHDGAICFYLESGSCAEFMIDSGDFFRGHLLSYDIEVPDNIQLYWFSRFKATREGHGDGTLLLKAVIAYFNEHRYDIFCQASAYGRMSQQKLEQFYEKYGFVRIMGSAFYKRAER